MNLSIYTKILKKSSAVEVLKNLCKISYTHHPPTLHVFPHILFLELIIKISNYQKINPTKPQVV